MRPLAQGYHKLPHPRDFFWSFFISKHSSNIENTNIETRTSRHEHQDTNIDIMEDVNTMEDFNLPSPERVALLERLQESIGDVPPHFWAACQICDLDALKNLVNCGRKYPNILSGLTIQTYMMAHYCK